MAPLTSSLRSASRKSLQSASNPRLWTGYLCQTRQNPLADCGILPITWTRIVTYLITEESSSNPSPATNVAVPVPAPVVQTRTAVTLADHLDLRNLPLATTPAGKNFAVKTLHPADSEIKIARAPGGLLPSVGISADMVDTLPFPSGSTSAYLVQTANIWVPLSIVFTDASGNYVDHYLWTNSALGGPGLLHAPTTWASIVANAANMYSSMSKFRVLSQSMTVDIIAPAVSDQGTIVASQFDSSPKTVSPGEWSSNQIAAGADLWMYRNPPVANSLLMGTSAYTSKAREGFYQPLKLDKFKWVDIFDTYFQSGAVANPQTWNTGLTGSHSNFPIYFNAIAAAATDVSLPKPSSNVVGLAWIEGVNPSSVSLRIRARQCIEVIPIPGGTYAPLAEAPYPPDELAFKMVREIAARMKDAYPASWNAQGTLKDAILKIGNGVLKFADPVLDAVSMVPGVGSIAGGIKVAKGIAKAVTSVAKAQPKQRQPAATKSQPRRRRRRQSQAQQNATRGKRSGLRIQRPQK